MTSMQRLRIALGLSLAATLAAAFWPLPPADSEVAPSIERGSPLAGVAPVGALATPAAQPAPSGRAPFIETLPGAEARAAAPRLPDRSAYADASVRRDPFALPPPPAPAAPVAPAASAPAAPPAPSPPWSFAGRLRVPGQPDAVLLHEGARTITLPLGAARAGWRLEADLGSSLEFTHLETGTRSVLSLPP